MLELYEFLLFLKVFYDLRKGLLKNLDLALEHLDLLLLLLASLVVLVSCAKVQHHVSLESLVLLNHLLLLSLIVVQRVPLTHCFLSQFLILVVDVSLDVLYIYIISLNKGMIDVTSLSIGLRLLLELLKALFIFGFNGFLHLGLLYLDVVLLLLDYLDDVVALILPVLQLSVIVYALLIRVLHVISLLPQLVDLHLVLN